MSSSTIDKKIEIYTKLKNKLENELEIDAKLKNFESIFDIFVNFKFIFEFFVISSVLSMVDKVSIRLYFSTVSQNDSQCDSRNISLDYKEAQWVLDNEQRRLY